jgi:hypothetical protein
MFRLSVLSSMILFVFAASYTRLSGRSFLSCNSLCCGSSALAAVSEPAMPLDIDASVGYLSTLPVDRKQPVFLKINSDTFQALLEARPNSDWKDFSRIFPKVRRIEFYNVPSTILVPELSKGPSLVDYGIEVYVNGGGENTVNNSVWERITRVREIAITDRTAVEASNFFLSYAHIIQNVVIDIHCNNQIFELWAKRKSAIFRNSFRKISNIRRSYFPAIKCLGQIDLSSFRQKTIELYSRVCDFVSEVAIHTENDNLYKPKFYADIIKKADVIEISVPSAFANRLIYQSKPTKLKVKYSTEFTNVASSIDLSSMESLKKLELKGDFSHQVLSTVKQSGIVKLKVGECSKFDFKSLSPELRLSLQSLEVESSSIDLTALQTTSKIYGFTLFGEVTFPMDLPESTRSIVLQGSLMSAVWINSPVIRLQISSTYMLSAMIRLGNDVEELELITTATVSDFSTILGKAPKSLKFLNVGHVDAAKLDILKLIPNRFTNLEKLTIQSSAVVNGGILKQFMNKQPSLKQIVFVGIKIGDKTKNGDLFEGFEIKRSRVNDTDVLSFKKMV